METTAVAAAGQKVCGVRGGGVRRAHRFVCFTSGNSTRGSGSEFGGFLCLVGLITETPVAARLGGA